MQSAPSNARWETSHLRDRYSCRSRSRFLATSTSQPGPEEHTWTQRPSSTLPCRLSSEPARTKIHCEKGMRASFRLVWRVGLRFKCPVCGPELQSPGSLLVWAVFERGVRSTGSYLISGTLKDQVPRSPSGSWLDVVC